MNWVICKGLLGLARTFSQTSVRSILHIAVLPAVRRQGIGSALLRAVVDRIAAKGARQAFSVYKDLGFALLTHDLEAEFLLELD